MHTNRFRGFTTKQVRNHEHKSVHGSNARGEQTLRGFTLIELLVVIAIIGILSGVVLASLSTARQKGNDAAIQSDLATIQTEAELYYGNTNNSYGTAISTGDCTTAGSMFTQAGDSVVYKALTGAQSAAGGATPKCYVATGGTAYAVSVQLNTKSGASTAYWCVDSSGLASKSTTVLSGTTCP